MTTLAADAATVKAFHKQFPGATSPFGAPNYRGGGRLRRGDLETVCESGNATRAAVRAQVAKTHLMGTLLGGDLSFTPTGDVAGAKFHVFKIENGSYVTVQ